MTPVLLYGALGLLLFARGLSSLAVQATGVRRLLAVNVMAIGIFLVLGALALRTEGPADPVPHAMVLTGIRGGGLGDRPCAGADSPAP
jgi:multicomponent Na+:H+ antiporter subunit C